jgi:sugar phosphate isomerase/epimerase
MYSRRQFGKLAVAGIASYSAFMLAEDAKAQAGGIRVGLNTFSLRTVPHDEIVDTVIKAMQEIGLTECELVANQIEPVQPGAGFGGRGPGVRAPLTPEQQAAQKAAAAALAQWRLTTPLDYFGDIRKKFNAAGINIVHYSPRFGDSDEENERVFVMAKTLGAEAITARVTPAMTQRIAAFAESHKMMVGIVTVDPAATALQLPVSKYFGIDLDIGDFTKAGLDPLTYVPTIYERLTCLHLKDCKLNGPSVPFGEGDSHMKEVLQFLKSKQAKPRVMIDCDYPGTGASIEEVKKCYAYAEAALA